MKKLISLLCIMTMIIGICAVSAVSTSAADAAKTAVDVKKGDKVIYTLKLSDVELPIVGCDYSIYYDSSILKVDSVADFNDKTNEDDWVGLINTGLDGEVRGNWSILNGVKFKDQRNFITVNMTAVADGTSELSYFIRYMYDKNIFNDDNKQQITDYLFTCDVKVEGTKVLEDAPPQLNTKETQTSGLFVNSVTGDSADADADIPGTVVKKNSANANSNSANAADNGGNNANNAANDAANAGNSGSNSGNGGSNAASGKNSVNGGSGSTTASSASSATAAPAATTIEGYFVVETDAEGNVTATSDVAPVTTTGENNEGGGNSIVIWIIVILLVLAGGGAAVFFYLKKKPSGGNPPVNQQVVNPQAPMVDDKAPTMNAAPAADQAPVAEGAPAAEQAPAAEEVPDDAKKTVALDQGSEQTVNLDAKD